MPPRGTVTALTATLAEVSLDVALVAGNCPCRALLGSCSSVVPLPMTRTAAGPTFLRNVLMLLFGKTLLLIVVLVHGPGTVPNNASSGLPLFFLCNERHSFFKSSIGSRITQKIRQYFRVCDSPNQIVFDDLVTVIERVGALGH